MPRSSSRVPSWSTNAQGICFMLMGLSITTHSIRRGCLAVTRIPPVFFFNVTATTEIYTLSLHDALPIFGDAERAEVRGTRAGHVRLDSGRQLVDLVEQPRRGQRQPGRQAVQHDDAAGGVHAVGCEDRKSTRLNSSHVEISYAVFCLKKKT